MILVFNVKITKFRLMGYDRSSHYPSDDRYEVFKYCLSSYSVCNPLITKSIFFIELSDEYKNMKDDLENHIMSNFTQEKVILNWYRNNYTSDWRKFYSDTLSSIDDEIIWLAVNDDHIFLDNNINTLKTGEKILNEDNNKMSSVIFSHWFEFIRIAEILNGVPIENNEYIKFKHNIFCGVQIITKQRFYRYWHEYDYGDSLVFRTDNLSGLSTNPFDGNMYVPTKELCRHYDGYSHVGNFPNIFPPLYIPPGFFEKNIKIRFGYEDRKEGYTSLNPSSELLFGKDIKGVDYRFTLDQIPIFWRDKISEIDINESYDINKHKEKINNYFLQSTYSITRSYNFTFVNKPPIEWFINHLL